MSPLRPWERFDNRAMLVLSSALGALALVIVWYLISGPRHQHPEMASRLPRRSSIDNVIELDEVQARALRHFLDAAGHGAGDAGGLPDGDVGLGGAEPVAEGLQGAVVLVLQLVEEALAIGRSLRGLRSPRS